MAETLAMLALPGCVAVMGGAIYLVGVLKFRDRS